MKPVGPICTGVLLLLLGIVAPMYSYQEQREQEAPPPKQEQQAKPDKKQQAKDKQQQAKEKKQQQEQAKQQQAKEKKQQQDQARQQQQQARDKQQQDRVNQQQQRAQQQQQAREKQQQDQVRQQQERAQQQQQVKDRQQQDQVRQQQQRTQQQDQIRQPQPQRQQQTARPSEPERRVQQGEQRTVWQERRARDWQSEHRTWQQRGGYNGYRIPEANFRGSFGQEHGFRIQSLPLVISGGYPRFQYGGFWFGVVDPWPEYWSDNWYDNDDVYIDYSGDGYYMYNRRYPRDRIAIIVSLNFVQQGELRGVWQERRARDWQSEHRTWRQRGGYDGYRIPDDRFRGYFGRNHAFRIYDLPLVLIGGYPRFQYNDLWFSVVDPWPEYWSDNWYENDDLYIDYSGDGYYLYNRRYPRDRIAITVYLN